MWTRIPDEENSLFEITGLAHQYTSYATVTRSATWIKRQRGKPKIIEGGPDGRSSMPGDSRRLRNRI